MNIHPLLKGSYNKSKCDGCSSRCCNEIEEEEEGSGVCCQFVSCGPNPMCFVDKGRLPCPKCMFWTGYGNEDIDLHNWNLLMCNRKEGLIK